MRKLLSIGAWFTVFMACGLLIFTFGPSVNSADFPRHSPGQRLTSFGERLDKFRAAPGPRTVIIGTCYALDIETPGESFNLSIEVSSPLEALQIARAYCRADDNLVIPVTIRDIHCIPPNSVLPPRRETFNDFARKAQLARMSAQRSAGIKPKQLKLTPAERTALYNRNFASIAVFDLSVYHQIHERFPNSIFVLFPTMSVDSLSGVKESLRQHLQASGLPIINLEDALPNEYFKDTFHLTAKGKEIMRGHVSSLTTSMIF